MMTSNSSLNQNKEPVLILVAAGSSTRMGTGIKKEYLPMNGGTVLSNAAKAFYTALNFALTVITYPEAHTEQSCKDNFFCDLQIDSKTQDILFVKGGNTRQASVFNALKAVEQWYCANRKEQNCVVFIHDGARPFVSSKIILDAYNTSLKYGSAVPGLQPVDTQTEIDENGFIKRHLKRSSLKAVQTPQVFEFKSIYRAHKLASLSKNEYTDDTEIWDEFIAGNDGYTRVKVIDGDINNRKITYPKDLDSINRQDKKMIRTGLGYDKHILTEGRKLILGGVVIPFEKGEDGHSDGDVLLHAVTDALLGACGMGDIGSYFPPEDAKWKDADSRVLLKTVWSDIKNAGWTLENMDCVIALQKPKFLPYRNQVIESIAKVLEVESNQIFVKAKTGEKIGDVGLGNCVEAWVTCLLSK